MKFVKLTDADQVKMRIQPTLSKEDMAKNMAYLSRFYVIADGDVLLGVEGSGEIVCLNIEEKRLGVQEFTIPCKLRPDARSKKIKRAVQRFGRAYQRRN